MPVGFWWLAWWLVPAIKILLLSATPLSTLVFTQQYLGVYGDMSGGCFQLPRDKVEQRGLASTVAPHYGKPGL